MATESLTKRVQINKATAAMVIIIGIASFITVFSLVASKALISQRSYQSRVIAGKEKAKKQLEDNIRAVDSLASQYKVFISGTENVLGGNPAGTGEKDGDNARIILDALPSKYDFPAVATSLEKILTGGGYKIEAISGSDQEASQQSTVTSSTPKPIDMPFQVGIAGNYLQIQSFIGVLEHSIRPIQIDTLSLTAADAQMHMAISAKTFYQPSKSLSITTREVK